MQGMQGIVFDHSSGRSLATPALFRPTQLKAWHKLDASVSIGTAPTPLAGAVHASAMKAAHIGADAARCWVHLCLFGTWKAHVAGEFEFSREVFDQIIGNFDHLENPVPWTIGHPDGATPAPGYVLQLAVKGDGRGDHDGLYALTEWTAKTAAEIREGGWRFCSVFVDFASIDRRTNEPIGCELIQVGLTNNPFIDGQKPINLSRFGASEKRTMKPTEIVVAFLKAAKLMKPTAKLDAESEMLKAIALCAKALNLPKGATAEDCVAALNGMSGYLKSKAGAAPDAPPDAEAAMSRADAAKYAAAFLALAKVKLDGPDAPAPDAMGGDGTDDEAAEGALLDTLNAILAKAGLDITSGKAALDANADAIATLLQGGGVPPMAADALPPAAMARLEAAQRGERDLKARVVELERQAKERDDAEKAKAAEVEAERVKLEREAQEKAKADKAAAEKAEAEAEIKAAIADGRLTLKAGKEEGSEVESARKFFLAAHTEALAWLKSKPAAVPTYGLSYGTPPSAADISASADKTAPEEIDLDPAKLSDDEKRLVAMQRGTPKQRAAMARAAIKIHRDRLSQLTH